MQYALRSSPSSLSTGGTRRLRCHPPPLPPLGSRSETTVQRNTVGHAARGPRLHRRYPPPLPASFSTFSRSAFTLRINRSKHPKRSAISP
ncbi:unnamed protein product [Ectocarpus sp. CCAP 1310/34]|nr:unnamed protein product [Ectocarpus sp. CCAP 1310/34]